MNQLSINNQSNILQRVKLLMEYDSSLTYDENLRLITEQDKKWISYLSKEITYQEAQELYKKSKYSSGFSDSVLQSQLETSFPNLKTWWSTQPKLDITPSKPITSPYERLDPEELKKMNPDIYNVIYSKKTEDDEGTILRLRRFLYETPQGILTDLLVRIFGEGFGTVAMTAIEGIILINDWVIYNEQSEEFKNKHWFLKLMDDKNQSYANLMTDVVFMGLFFGVPAGYGLAKNVIRKATTSSGRKIVGESLVQSLKFLKKLISKLYKVPSWIWEKLGLKNLFVKHFPNFTKWVDREIMALEFKSSSIDFYLGKLFQSKPSLKSILTTSLKRTIGNLSNWGKWKELAVSLIIFKCLERGSEKLKKYLETPEGQEKLLGYLIKLDPSIEQVISDSQQAGDENEAAESVIKKINENPEFDITYKTTCDLINQSNANNPNNRDINKPPFVTIENCDFSRWKTKNIIKVNNECYEDKLEDFEHAILTKIKC